MLWTKNKEWNPICPHFYDFIRVDSVGSKKGISEEKRIVCSKEDQLTSSIKVLIVLLQ